MAAVLARHGGVVSLRLPRARRRPAAAARSATSRSSTSTRPSRWARLLGYAPVVTVGFSMGAGRSWSGTRRCIARGRRRGRGERPRPLVLPRHGADAAGCTGSSSAASGRAPRPPACGTRIPPRGWDPCPLEPRGARPATSRRRRCCSCTATGPLTSRWSTPTQLAEAGGPTAELWVEPGFGHAEAAIDEPLTRRIEAWVRQALASTPAGRRADA